MTLSSIIVLKYYCSNYFRICVLSDKQQLDDAGNTSIVFAIDERPNLLE
jgi:hypothetical protein